MMAYMIKAFSFFMKEFYDVWRQPRLIISLVGGPLLVLGAFGATFQSGNPFVRVVLVWPKNEVPGVSQAQAANILSQNFYLVKVTNDENEAMRMLEEDQADVVQIVPDLSSTVGDNGHPEIKFISRAIDPNAEAWIKSVGYAELNFINKQLLTYRAKLAQENAKGSDLSLAQVGEEFTQLRDELDALGVEHAGAIISELRSVLTQLQGVLPSEDLAQTNISPELSQIHHDIDILVDELDGLETVLREGNRESQVERLNNAIEGIAALRGTIDLFATTAPENIISPVRETYTNLRGEPYPLVVFFAPAVLALLIQQLAITLASLGLVRERQMGSFEMFRVAPLRFSQILLGKSLAYILFSTTAGLVLTALLKLLKVPLPEYPVQFLVALILLATASVGIGFLISAMSRTDSQAIQLTMLVWLLSIVFTGFFMPIVGFRWPAWIIALLIPMTHAILIFQNLILAGNPSNIPNIISLIVIALLAFGLVLLIMKRQYQKISD